MAEHLQTGRPLAGRVAGAAQRALPLKFGPRGCSTTPPPSSPSPRGDPWLVGCVHQPLQALWALRIVFPGLMVCTLAVRDNERWTEGRPGIHREPLQERDAFLVFRRLRPVHFRAAECCYASTVFLVCVLCGTPIRTEQELYAFGVPKPCSSAQHRVTVLVLGELVCPQIAK